MAILRPPKHLCDPLHNTGHSPFHWRVPADSWGSYDFLPSPLKGVEMRDVQTQDIQTPPGSKHFRPQGYLEDFGRRGKVRDLVFFPFLRICRFRSFSVAGEIPGTEDRMCQAARRRLRCGCVCWYQRSDLGAGFYTPEIFTWNL